MSRTISETPASQRATFDSLEKVPMIGRPDARAVMLLRYQEDLDPVEIARTLDMSINTVKSHLKRSLTTLRARVMGAALVDPAPDLGRWLALLDACETDRSALTGHA